LGCSPYTEFDITPDSSYHLGGISETLWQGIFSLEPLAAHGLATQLQKSSEYPRNPVAERPFERLIFPAGDEDEGKEAALPTVLKCGEPEIS
jgi:hypothetical protein